MIWLDFRKDFRKNSLNYGIQTLSALTETFNRFIQNVDGNSNVQKPYRYYEHTRNIGTK